MLICQMNDINRMSRRNSLTQNKRNSVPCMHIRTSRKRSCNQGIVCNDWNLDPLVMQNGLALGCYQPSPEVLIVWLGVIFKETLGIVFLKTERIAQVVRYSFIQLLFIQLWLPTNTLITWPFHKVTTINYDDRI